MISLRHAIFVIAAFAGLFLTWPYAFDWMRNGGNILNAWAFFADALRPGGTAAFLSLDILFVWGVYIVWVIGDARRIGLGSGTGVLFAVLSYLGVCFSMPLYLVRRERWLDRQKQVS